MFFSAPNELGWTEDPTALIPGDPEQVWNTVRAFHAHAQRLQDVAQALRTIDTSEWNGPAAEAFNACFDHQPSRWFTASDAFFNAAPALDSHAFTLQWAQREAREAVILWDKGVAATQEAAARNPMLSSLKVADLNGLLRLPFVLPVPGDPGAALRDRARSKVDHARQQVDDSGHDAAAKVRAACEAAPPEPNILDRIRHILEPVTAYNHYLYGHGTDITSRLHDYKWNELTLASFHLQPDKQSFPHDGIYTIGPEGSGSDITVKPAGLSAQDPVGWLKIRGLSADLKGELTVRGTEWEFVGVAEPRDDIFDFDVGQSNNPMREAFTAAGYGYGEYMRISSLGVIQPESFTNVIDGAFPIHERGTFD